MDPEQSVLDQASRLTTDERRRSGRELRKRIPRSSFGGWQPAADRVDVVEQLAEQEVTRVAELIPVRHERMAVSPFTFFRGAAKVFAADLADQPRSGLTVQLCGDAHLSNFGGFASPERTLVFDINDFDETLPGPFEWDLQRLAASVEIACRDNGFDEADRRRAQTELVASYAKGMRQFSAMSHLDIWYTQVTLDQVTSQWGDELSKAMRERVTKSTEKAQSKNRLKAFKKLTTVVDGQPQFLSDPPLLERVTELSSGDDQAQITKLVDDVMTGYRQSLQPDRRVLLDRYEFVDLARKVVGVGSVGTRCWVTLFVGKDDSDPLFLQLKEAEASVMEPHLGPSEYPQHGQRVVEGQRLTQAASDVLLGWERNIGLDGRPHDYYFRQLWDWKASADVAAMDPSMLVLYARLCAYTLARAHARTGDAIAISAYVGTGKTLGAAMTEFSFAYADQNERDHATFVAAVGSDAG